jgi:hypothetical protein
MSPAEEIARYLAGQGIGTLAGGSSWGVYFSRMPDAPDDCVCVFDSGGGPPIAYDITLREPAVQVRIRGTVHADVHTKADEIFDLLCEPGDIPGPAREIENGLYLGFWMDSDFIDLGRDENERIRLTSNYRINRQPLEGSS